jgi:hypothetical protein
MAGYIFCPFPLPPPLWGRTQMRGEPRPFPPSQPSPAQGGRSMARCTRVCPNAVWPDLEEPCGERDAQSSGFS